MGLTIISGGGGGGDADNLATYRSEKRVGYWPCDDDGTAGLADAEGSNDMTENGTSVAVFGNTGVRGAGTAVGITGDNDRFYVQSSDVCPDLTEDVALSFWLKSTSTGTRNIGVFSASPTSLTSPYWFLQLLIATAPRMGIIGSLSAHHPKTGLNIQDGNFHHFLAILKRAADGDQLCKFYVDGYLVASLNVATPYDFSPGAIIIGRVSGNSVFTGDICEIEVFKGVNATPSEKVIAEMAAEY